MYILLEYVAVPSKDAESCSTIHLILWLRHDWHVGQD